MRLISRSPGNAKAVRGLVANIDVLPDRFVSYGFSDICIWDLSNLEHVTTLQSVQSEPYKVICSVTIINAKWLMCFWCCARSELWDISQNRCIAYLLGMDACNEEEDNWITMLSLHGTGYLDLNGLEMWLENTSRLASSRMQANESSTLLYDLVPLELDFAEGCCRYSISVGEYLQCQVDFARMRCEENLGSSLKSNTAQNEVASISSNYRSKIMELMDADMYEFSIWLESIEQRAVGCKNGLIMLVNSAKDKCTETLTGHTAAVKALAKLPDNKIASGSSDGSIRLWSLDSMSCIAIFTDQGGPVLSLLELPDDKMISRGEDGSLILWDQSETVLL